MYHYHLSESTCHFRGIRSDFCSFSMIFGLGYMHQENKSVKCIPLKPHFYIEKLGFAGAYLIFLFLIQNIDCGYSLESPHRVHLSF